MKAPRIHLYFLACILLSVQVSMADEQKVIQSSDVTVTSTAASKKSSTFRQAPQTVLAEAATLADGISAYWAIDKGHRERNPLMPSKKRDILLVTALKIGALAAVDAYASDVIRDRVMISTAAVSGGLMVNNILVGRGHKSKVSVPIGIAAGVGIFMLNQRIAKNHAIRVGLGGIEYHTKF